MTFSLRCPTTLAGVWYLFLLMGSTALGDIVEMQLPGTYSAVSLGMESGAETVCASSLKIALLEVTGTAAKQLFVIPHSAFEVPTYSTERTPGFQQCTALTMEYNAITRNASATVLRRSRDLAGMIDMRVDLLKNLQLLRENYFVGYEHGDRICNGYSKLPSETISVWFAPGQRFSATYKDLLLNFQTGDKYIFYFSENMPCFYKADSKVVENVNIIRSPLGTITPPNGRGENSGKIQGNSNAKGASPVSETTQPSGPACFPGDARVKVRVQNGFSNGKDMDVGMLYETKIIAISELKIGDMVCDGIEGDEKWTRVIAQTHADEGVITSMVQIDARGNYTHSYTGMDRRLTLSADHLVPRWDSPLSLSRLPILILVPASKLHVGDIIGNSLVITDVTSVEAKGLFAPVTESGTMRVDDVFVSCYAVDWRLAHALLAPLRLSVVKWEGLMRRLRLLRATYEHGISIPV